MSEVGWLAVWRRLREHWIWKEKPFSPGQAWLDILIRANWETKAIPDPGRVGAAWLAPGEAIVSHRGLCSDWGWSRNRVQRFLKALIDEAMLETTNEATFTRLKVLNWNRYQTPVYKDEATNGPTRGATPGARSRPPPEPGANPILRREQGKQVKKRGERVRGRNGKTSEARDPETGNLDILTQAGATTPKSARSALWLAEQGTIKLPAKVKEVLTKKVDSDEAKEA